MHISGLVDCERGEVLVVWRRRSARRDADRLGVGPRRAVVEGALERDVRPGGRPVQVVLVDEEERPRHRVEDERW